MELINVVAIPVLQGQPKTMVQQPAKILMSVREGVNSTSNFTSILKDYLKTPFPPSLKVTPDICGVNQVCSDTHGGFNCSCEIGYQGTIGIDQPTTCVNINECLEDVCAGDSEQSCTDLPGTFMCACGVGYSGSAGIGSPAECFDINECLNDPCVDPSSIQICNNTIGSFSCSCGEGYQGLVSSGEPAQCENIDECVADPCTNPGRNERYHFFKLDL